MQNGRWGNDDDTILTIGYGGHLIRFKKHIFYVTLSEREAQATREDKEILTIRKLGRNRKIFEEFFEEVTKPKIRKNIIVYDLNESWWRPRTEIPSRSFDSVFMESDNRKLLVTTIDKFISSETWYVEHGIPYQLGILLHGIPGSGKSSLIRAIASYLKYDIYYLSSSQLYRLDSGLEKLPSKGSIMVIEDIDCSSTLHSRHQTPEQKLDNSPKLENLMLGSIANLADVLNLIDGLCSTHGRILIMTTNFIDKLDPALLRPGRIDLSLKMGYVNNEILTQFAHAFYDHDIPSNFVSIRPKLSCADLQGYVLEGCSLDEILSRVGIHTYDT